VAFTGSRRQWSVPVSVAVGVMMLIGFWPAPSQISLVDASQSALAVPISSVSSTIAIEPTSQMLSASSPGGTTDAPSPRSFEVPAQDVPPLRLELLVLGESPVGGADVKVIEDVERPNNESGRFGVMIKLSCRLTGPAGILQLRLKNQTALMCCRSSAGLAVQRR